MHFVIQILVNISFEKQSNLTIIGDSAFERIINLKTKLKEISSKSN